MKRRILTLISICVVIAVSVAFTMPGKKQSKNQPAVAKTEANGAALGGYGSDQKD
jgi:anti-sigma-K factor RskA